MKERIKTHINTISLRWRLVWIGILMFFCLQTSAQSRFERYVDSLLGVNNQLKYKDLKAFEKIAYDSINKGNNIGFWIDICFKKLGIENYLGENSKYLELGEQIEISVVIDSNGIVKNTFVNEKKVAKFIQKQLVGSSFYKDYIQKLKVNGICISKIDEDFYKDYFLMGQSFSFTVSDRENRDCDCDSK